MATDDGPQSRDDTSEETTDESVDDLQQARERLETEAERAVEEFDKGLIDLLAWLLDTETRARIYVYLRQHPNSTSDEVAEGTGLYPSTVREALAELSGEGTVTRQKRDSEGAGNNPYEYQAIPPSELVNDAVGQVQQQLNTVFNLDQYLTGKPGSESEESEPVRITVESPEESDEREESED